MSGWNSFGRPARLFLIAVVIDGIVFSAWSLFFNFYILERGFSREFLGLITASSSVAALVLGIPLGLLSDRIGRKRAMLVGVCGFVVASGLQVTLLNPSLILLAGFISGAANALYYLSQAPFMMKVSNEENRTLLFSLSFGLVTLSGTVGSLFAGQLPALFGRWMGVAERSAAAYQAVLLLAVALGALTLLPLLLIQEPRRSPESAQAARPRLALGRVLANRLTLQLALPNVLIGFGAAILIPYMNLFFHDRFAISDSRLGLLFSLSALLTGVGSVISPRIARRLGSKIRAVAVTQSLSLGFLLVVGFSPWLWLASAGFLLRGVLMNLAVPLFDAFSMEQVPESEQGAVNSVRSLAWQLGFAIGPYISGVVQAQHGFTPLFISTAVLYGLATLLTWVFFRGHEAARAAQMLRERMALPAAPTLTEEINA